jgi:hypothetical protein
MTSNFNCSYMARISLTYIPGFIWGKKNFTEKPGIYVKLILAM